MEPPEPSPAVPSPLRLALVGERVLLRPHAASDAAWAFPMLSGRDEILRWLVWRGPADEEELAALYARWLVRAENGEGEWRFAVVERAGESGVGSLTIRLRGNPPTADVGYWIGSEHQGRGYATEAVELATLFAFRHLRAQVLCGWVFVGNEPSRAVLERAGYRLVRTGAERRLGDRRISEWYLALLRSEWETRARPYRPVEIELGSDESAFGDPRETSGGGDAKEREPQRG